MKIQISSFSVLLVFGLVLLTFLIWCLSLFVLVDQQHRQNAVAFQQSWHGQVLQLQQKQKLWLQSQFYLLNTLVESRSESQKFQSFVWDYYQRNPSIWAVNLVHFDQEGLPLSKSTKPGCLQPQQMHKKDFKVYQVPRTASCRIDDKALLEISGPVSVDGETAVLLVSMDYFSFLVEFSSLSLRNMQRGADNDDGIQYLEFAADGNQSARVVIPIGEGEQVYGQLHLLLHPLSFWDLFQRQALLVFVVMILAALLVALLFHYQLIKPLLELAQKMRSIGGPQSQQLSPESVSVAPGLKVMHKYFQALKKMAKRDPLTGLNNRVIFEDRLLQAIREGKRNARRYALILVEVKGLDGIAHQRGQYVADAVLKQVSDRLRAGLRETDNVARFEQHLFALLLEVREQDQLISLVEKIYLSVTRQYQIYDRNVDISAGLGISIYPDHAIEAEQLYRNASVALVEAQYSEWPIVFFRDFDDDSDTSGFTLIQSLRKAIDNEELKLVFQPVVDLVNHQTSYFEALLRWRDPKKHKVSIEKTIHLAEQNNLIKPLSNWIFEAASRFISESGIDDLVVGINLSMIDLHDRLLPERIGTYLQRYGVKPAQIVIEITEGQIMQDRDEVIEVLAHLGVMGLSLSIDDFGTGQASLTYLKDLPVEKLKIDQSFVRDIATNPDDQSIVKATIQLAHTLDLKVIAEGVETVEVYDLLGDMDCDYAQGYYISHPIEADEIAAWYETVSEPDSKQG